MDTHEKCPQENGIVVPEQPFARLTPRRQAVLDALLSTHSHPTVRELHQLMPIRISLATVYNAIDYLKRVDLINEHRLNSGPARFCINHHPHMHMVDERTGKIVDVFLKEGVTPEDVFDLPKGAKVSSISAYLYGYIPRNSNTL